MYCTESCTHADSITRFLLREEKREVANGTPTIVNFSWPNGEGDIAKINPMTEWNQRTTKNVPLPKDGNGTVSNVPCQL